MSKVKLEALYLKWITPQGEVLFAYYPLEDGQAAHKKLTDSGNRVITYSVVKK